jgi:hypothetical protein
VVWALCGGDQQMTMWCPPRRDRLPGCPFSGGRFFVPHASSGGWGPATTPAAR